MLGKLIKHEFKATSRVIPFIYLTAAVFTLATYMGYWMHNEALGSFAYFLTIMTGTGALISTLVIAAMRFYKSVFDSEGYLTMTLPVTTGQLMLSKALVYFVWIIASGVVMTLSLFYGTAGIAGINNPLAELAEIIPTNSDALIVYATLLVTILLGIIYFISLFFFSAAFGNTGIFHKQGSGICFLVFLGLTIVIDIIKDVITYFLPLSLAIGENGIYLSREPMTDAVEGLIFGTSWSMPFGDITSVIIQLVLTAVFFTLTYKLLKRRICVK